MSHLLITDSIWVGYVNVPGQMIRKCLGAPIKQFLTKHILLIMTDSTF